MRPLPVPSSGKYQMDKNRTTKGRVAGPPIPPPPRKKNINNGLIVMVKVWTPSPFIRFSYQSHTSKAGDPARARSGSSKLNTEADKIKARENPDRSRSEAQSLIIKRQN